MPILKCMSDFKLPEDLTKWPPEDDMGFVEYKSRLSKLMEARKWNRLITQLKWRLGEGADISGIHETIYIIGLYDDGTIAELTKEEMEISIDVMEDIVKICDAFIDKMTFADTGKGQLTVLHIKSNNQPERKYPLFSKDEEQDDELPSSDCDDIIDM